MRRTTLLRSSCFEMRYIESDVDFNYVNNFKAKLRATSSAGRACGATRFRSRMFKHERTASRGCETLSDVVSRREAALASLASRAGVARGLWQSETILDHLALSSGVAASA